MGSKKNFFVKTLKICGKALEVVGFGFFFFLEFYLSEEKSLKSFDLFKIFCVTGFSCDLII